jgi:hypothetical protein
MRGSASELTTPLNAVCAVRDVVAAKDTLKTNTAKHNILFILTIWTTLFAYSAIPVTIAVYSRKYRRRST